MSGDIVEGFATLFAGRTDAYGTEEGGCIRVADESEDWRYFMAHLDGETPIGVYPMRSWVMGERDDYVLWQVKWGCVDLDVKAEGKRRYDFESAEMALIAARNLHAVLASFGVTSWIERTKSGGYHVWVFSSEWVSGATMRRALIVACRIGNVPTTEVNPKAESFDDPSSLGNYVRLPYPGGDACMNRYILYLSGPGRYLLSDFVEFALADRCTSATLEPIAALYIEDKPLPRARTMGAVGQVSISKEITDKMSPLTYHIFTHGPSEQSDRSTTLARLAYRCRDDGLSEEEAFQVLVEADIAHGQKFTHRKDSDRRYWEMVERAYA